jgi:hypothetical protein
MGRPPQGFQDRCRETKAALIVRGSTTRLGSGNGVTNAGTGVDVDTPPGLCRSVNPFQVVTRSHEGLQPEVDGRRHRTGSLNSRTMRTTGCREPAYEPLYRPSDALLDTLPGRSRRAPAWTKSRTCWMIRSGAARCGAWRVRIAAECTGLENRRPRKGSVGSNPTPSAMG